MSVKARQIPHIPLGVSRDVRRVLESMKENIELLVSEINSLNKQLSDANEKISTLEQSANNS